MERKRVETKLHLLTVRTLQTAADGDHFDGGGLLLRIRGKSAAWVLRYTSPAGRRREMGLGPAYMDSAQIAGKSLSTARELAHLARELLKRDIDPIDEKARRRKTKVEAEKAKKVEKAQQRLTLARHSRDYYERVVAPRLTPKHAAQWISSLENHVPSEVWHAPIASINPPQLLAALAKVRPHERARNLKSDDRVPETLRRIRQRLDTIFEDAIFVGHCSVNPAAAIRRKMREQLPVREEGKFAALPFKEAPAFMWRLREAEGIAARCLEFLVLTASRTSEALGAVWSEFDLDNAAWIVPAARMKASGKTTAEEHVVHLPMRAVEILKAQEGMDTEIVFPSTVGEGKHLSNMALLAVLDRLGMRKLTTVHGLRATFSTWAYETNAARPDVIEACLAHREADKVKRAYNRSDFAVERKALLDRWADFVATTAMVVPIRAA
jgi:integrase